MNPSEKPAESRSTAPEETGAKSFREASEAKELSLGQEIVLMLKDNKKYWMIPLIGVLLILGLIVILGANPSTAPFIYSLF
jgi:hypothetical protein